jgi:uncharacterized membrane protein YdbT with pleckstrin-like domain
LAFDLALLVYFFSEFLVCHMAKYIVTDYRLVRQEGLFSISSFDAAPDKINNIFHRQTLLGRLLKYGDVGLETASEQETTVFDCL